MDQQPQASFGSSNKRVRSYGRILLVALAAVVLIAAAIAAYMVFNKSSDPAGKTAAYTQPTVCSNEMNQQASEYLNNDSANLGFTELRQKILAQKEYKQDPNCVYVLLTYNLSKNISTDNEMYLTTLTDLYTKGAKLSGVFEPSYDINELKTRVDSVKVVNDAQDAADKQADENSAETEQYVEDL